MKSQLNCDFGQSKKNARIRIDSRRFSLLGYPTFWKSFEVPAMTQDRKQPVDADSSAGTDTVDAGFFVPSARGAGGRHFLSTCLSPAVSRDACLGGRELPRAVRTVTHGLPGSRGIQPRNRILPLAGAIPASGTSMETPCQLGVLMVSRVGSEVPTRVVWQQQPRHRDSSRQDTCAGRLVRLSLGAGLLKRFGTWVTT